VTSSNGSADRDPGIEDLWPGEEGRGLALVDRDSLIDHIDDALAHPPVGVLLAEWDAVPSLRVGPPDEAAYDPVAVAILAGTRPDDLIVSGGPGLVAVVRQAMTSPAEAEGLAYRIVARFRPTGDPVDDPPPAWAIGVATSHRSDTAADLLRWAEHALSDAQLLGGDRIAAFDDTDRLLLTPVPDADAARRKSGVGLGGRRPF
jgi:hypothetical protein